MVRGDLRAIVCADAFGACLNFCATGGYTLQAYAKWQRLLHRPDGCWPLRDPRATQRIRMNLGTIQDSDTLKPA